MPCWHCCCRCGCHCLCHCRACTCPLGAAAATVTAASAASAAVCAYCTLMHCLNMSPKCCSCCISASVTATACPLPHRVPCTACTCPLGAVATATRHCHCCYCHFTLMYCLHMSSRSCTMLRGWPSMGTLVRPAQQTHGSTPAQGGHITGRLRVVKLHGLLACDDCNNPAVCIDSSRPLLDAHAAP